MRILFQIVKFILPVGIRRVLLRSHRAIQELRKRQRPRTGLNLNVGCGDYKIKGFLSLDYYSDYYHPKGIGRGMIHYDMRADDIPFANNTIDTIFCSHVIEHIETEHVKRFFFEGYRVLKKGSVMRITCPDAEFLYENYLNHPEYFSWHPSYASEKDAEVCFVDEVAFRKTMLPNYGLDKNIREFSYDSLLEELRSGLVFDPERPGDHINNVDFDRLASLGKEAGFERVLKSRFQGSFCETLRRHDIDLSHPQMSLYVDFVK